MLGNMKGWEWILILVLALVLFGGAKKLPDAARGLGRSLRIFKAETKGLVNEDSEGAAKTDAPNEPIALTSSESAESAPVAERVGPGKPTA